MTNDHFNAPYCRGIAFCAKNQIKPVELLTLVLSYKHLTQFEGLGLTELAKKMITLHKN